MNRPFVFIAGPFSAALGVGQSQCTIDGRLRAILDSVRSSVARHGGTPLSAHYADAYGAEFDETTFVSRDLEWVSSCDIFLALFPLDPQGKRYPTDGTFVELGHALALGKHTAVAIEEGAGVWSEFSRSLRYHAPVNTIAWRDLESNTHTVLQDIMCNWSARANQLGQREGRIQTTNPMDALALLRQRADVEQVSVSGMDLEVFPDVFSPSVSHSPDFLLANLPDPKGCSVLDMGSGSGVLGIGALRQGARRLVAVDSNQSAVANTRHNIRRLGYGNSAEVIQGHGFDALQRDQRFDLIILSPPYHDREAPDELSAACFDRGHGFLLHCMRECGHYLEERGKVAIVFSDQGDLNCLLTPVWAGQLEISRIAVKRPTMTGGHVRFYCEYRRNRLTNG